MPFVRISLPEGTSPEYRKAIADGFHRAVIESIAIPPGDRFQVITQHPPGDLIYARTTSAFRVRIASCSCKSL